MPLKITIAGGGIGGLSAAIGLARNGHKVTIYERLSHSGGVGYSFHIMRNAARCLEYLNIDPRETGAVTSVSSRHYLAANGHLLREVSEGQAGSSSGGDDDSDGLFVGFVSRSALSSALTAAALSSGVEIHNNAKAVSVDLSRGTLSFADGTSSPPADVVLGADGIHSVVRRAFVEGSAAEPRNTGNQSAVRFLIPMSRVRDNPETAGISPSQGISAMWFAKDRRLIAYPVDFGEVMSIASAYPKELSEGAVEGMDGETAASYSKQVSLATVVDIHKDFEPRVQSLLRLADPEGFRVWKLEDLDDIGAWSSGRTTVLGDACHATLPGAFSGAAMAIEDGITLAILLDENVKFEEVHERFAVYERIRKPRIDRVREFGRNLQAAAMSDVDIRSYAEFVDSFDAVSTAEKALESISA